MPSASRLSPPASTTSPRLVVVKLGTGVLTSGVGQLDEPRIAAICAQIAGLRACGTRVLVVSSGAVGLGMGALTLAKRPRELSKKQACAAVGQSLLMQTWQRGFAPHRLTVAQVLLTHDDLRLRSRYLAVKETFAQLLDYGVVPVINENDTVSAAEIKFGDNDTLSAMVASVVQAQHLIILSTAPGLIDLKGSGKIIPVVGKITPDVERLAGGTTSETAVGGMISKISAARLATKAGCGVFIASGAVPEVLPRLLAGESVGTFFVPSGLPLAARKRWLAYFQRPAGTIQVNAGAARALREGGRSLLAVGVTGASGTFTTDDVVNIAGPDGAVFARGQSAYAADDIPALAGRQGDAVAALYPQRKRLEVVHRDNLVLL